ncbi:DNA polymerase III subunit delta' [Lacticaseibacillus daqingensis]|uniref:DNA polymerase III subunit delta' n=1 Tax=Lacticaseibacillus daqingensis TaxID=2486014 RepID=UPI000F78BDAB|nr:DNA polymerase III subunit delta' [Lacticaseibacillus daqingensis]
MPAITSLQPRLVAQFDQIVARAQLSQAYIFNGPSGTGKAQLAEWLAMRLFCENLQAGMPCGQCPECQRILTKNHPDVVWLTSDAKSIKVDDMRALKAEMSKSGVEGNQRVFIITDADKLTAGAANSLLKFYEEPVPGMTIILTTTTKNQLLPTILSRAQVINFPAPPRDTVAAELVESGVPARLANLAAHLTVDVTAGQALAADPNFEPRLTKVLALVSKLTNHDDTAFVAVQTTLMPLAKSLPDQQQLLAMLALAYADALNRHYEVPTTGAYGNDATIQVLAAQPARRLSDGLAAVLAAQIQLSQNVTFQSTLEALVLELL